MRPETKLATISCKTETEPEGEGRREPLDL